MNSPRLWIGGEWVETGQTTPVSDPFTGEEFARVPLGDGSTLSAAVVSARETYAKVRTRPAHARATMLLAIARGIEARKVEFAETILREAGKPIVFAEAEVTRAIMTFTCAAEEARRVGGEVLDMDAFASGEGHLGMVRRFPIGVIAGITPFNFPLNLVAHKVAPALATNNCLVLKPAPRTPLSSLLLGEVLAEAGVPAGQVNVVTCANEDVQKLVTDERVTMISFTGSPAVGWPLKAMAGKKKVLLELGGNAAVIVHDDADLEIAVPMIAAGGFGYAGQSCISVQRIFVHAGIYADFKKRLLSHVAEKIQAGDPRDRATVVGPMISPAAADRVRAQIASAVEAGAALLCGRGGSGAMVPATVLENVPQSHEASASELFAPVVMLEKYTDFDEAIRRVNDSDFGLQAGIFTRDLARALRAYAQLEVGAVLVNQVPTFRVENMPYGGIKDSGFGREGLRYAMEEMTELKSLIIRS
jgi:acyl-CoA reductase-like NAD-dependent aldehyde dehydrogenase